MPQVRVKDNSTIQANYIAGANRAQTPYQNAVKVADAITPGTTDQAEQNYATATQAAIAAKSRQSQLRKISVTDWQTAAATKGGPRIGPGMVAGAPKQIKNVAPYLDVIRNYDYPAKTLDPGQNIDNRVKGPAIALATLKKQTKGQM
jgi:hypothetical protein